jgi:UDP-N-acetylglucosamine acyltransferase
MKTKIHSTVVIEGEVEVGRGTVIMPYAVILGPCRIGENNWIGPHAVIGTPSQYRGGQHPNWEESTGGAGVEIGDDNRIREFVTIHQGSTKPTRIHNNCYLMAYAHVPHDAEYEDEVTIANATQVGGHTWLGEGATIGLGVDIRQRICIGQYAMVGMNSTVTSHVPPFSLALGSPARAVGVNRVGLDRSDLTDPETIDELDEHYKTQGEELPDFLDGVLREMLDRFRDRLGQNTS